MARLYEATRTSTQTELSYAIGIKKQTLTSHKKRGTFPEKLLRRVGDRFAVDYQWLLSGKPGVHVDPRPTRQTSEDLIYKTPPAGVDPDAWLEIRALLPRLSLIYEAQELLAHAKRWGWIAGNIETFSDMVKVDVEEHRKAKRKARDAG